MDPSLLPLSLVGIGSVPWREARNACEMILERWDIPFWPQYPSRSWRENFLFQFLASFPGLQVSDRAASFDFQEYARKEKAYRERLEGAFLEKNFLAFEPPPESALGYYQMKSILEAGGMKDKPVIKLQVTGSETIWNSFFAKQVHPPSAERIKPAVIKTLILAGLAQIQRIQSFKKIPLIFVDEPVPASLRGGKADDTSSSAAEPRAISKPRLLRPFGARNDSIEPLSDLSAMFHIFRKAGALTGLHLCSDIAWQGFENLEIDFFHFDLSLSSKKKEEKRRWLRTFLKRKKGIVWGAAPTRPAPENARDFSPLLLDYLKGIADWELTLEGILENSLLAPACGTGTLTPEEDEAVFQSLQATRDNLKMNPL